MDQQIDPPVSLASFTDGLRAVVVGAGGGIGSAVVDLLASSPRVARVYGLTRTRPVLASPRVVSIPFDLRDEASIAGAADRCAEDGPLHLVFVATGVLHDGAGLKPEKSWRALTAASLAESFAVNAIGPALIAKHFLERLATGERAVFAALSARVGSIEDNRLGGWYAYRATKAALHMLMRTSAIELARRNPTAVCVALHPGTVDTALSRPFQSGVPAGRLFSPRQAAEHLLRVIDSLDASASGRAFAWDGQSLPF
jgi:NAD(P)-dependent dehydrogenase (short-subunit alcohol dehydrogenase family)